MKPFPACSRLLLVTTLACVCPGAVWADEPEAPPLGLRAAIAEALRESPRLEGAQDDAAVAGIQRGVARARFSPRISPALRTGTSSSGLAERTIGLSVSQLLPTGGQAQGTINSQGYGAGLATQADTGYSVGISQPLLRGFGVTARAELHAADRSLEAAKRAETDARQQLIMAVAQAYFAVVREQRLVSEAARAVERAVKLGEMAEARARVGLSTQLDVLRAGQLRTQAQAAALRESDAAQSALDELKLLLGRPAGESLVVDEDLATDLDAIAQATPEFGDRNQGTADALVLKALAERLDVVNARARLTDARERVSLARWNMLPPVSLDISYTRRGLGAPPDAFTSSSNGWRIGVSTAYSLDRGGDRAAVGLAELAVRTAERAVSDAEQRAAVDLGQAVRAVSRADDVIAVYRGALALANEQRELATLRYERGLADNLEVVDAENSAFQAESALIAAELDRAMSVLSLQRASGALDPERFLP